jgi:hypothetical protein
MRMSHQQESEYQPHENAYYVDERTWVKVKHRGAFFSLVTFTQGGVSMEVYVENSDLIFKENEDDDAL